MKIGINVPTLGTRLGDVGVLAKRAEDLGFESFWAPEHAIAPVHYIPSLSGRAEGPFPEHMFRQAHPLIALARASATTQTIKLGIGVLLVTEHNPLDLAKQISTLDMYSGGRLLLGVGTGWFREEVEVMGGDFEHRWSQGREALLAMKELWTNDEAKFHGKYFDFPPVRCSPRPVQNPHPPILLGGSAPNVRKRVVDIADGWIPSHSNVSPEEIKRSVSEMGKMAVEAGRDPASIEISIFAIPPERDMVLRYEEAGAVRVTVRLGAIDHEPALAEMDELAAKVMG